MLSLARVRRYVVDLFWRHLFWGTICHLRGGHLALVPVAQIGKPGFRGVPILQCRRCLNLYILDGHAKKFGGRPA